jgi:L-rhamnonate dehydratase
MKIRSVHAFAIRSDLVGGPARTAARRPAWVDHAEVANPMSAYPRFKRLRAVRRLGVPANLGR